MKKIMKKEGGRERENMRQNGKQRETYRKYGFTKICHKMKQFPVKCFGGTFAYKSVLRGTRSLCATLNLPPT